ncbi:hypothetical protein GTQ34_10025 [Muricauda sp. JGD-17]|uniref:Uncharacterized protein n=1 Tax=Flagellimonas ochracea TaxID=2696472 RepID=A0A964WXV5_9FLAO|nr:hypothetical protein [Allomuricauda ochracea]NAY92257.1 hypothetical protein [Allomuricauda ochracea]
MKHLLNPTQIIAFSIILIIGSLSLTSCSSSGDSEDVPPTTQEPNNNEEPSQPDSDDTDSDDEVSDEDSSCNIIQELKPIIGEYGENSLTIILDWPHDNFIQDSGEYGFVLRRLYDSKEENLLGSDSESGFSLMLDNIIEGFQYEIFGYVTVDGLTCTSISESFVAETSYPMSPWSYMPSGVTYTSNYHGITVGGEPFILLQDGRFFKINENIGTLEQGADFPTPESNPFTGYTRFDLEESAFVKSTFNNSLQRYDQNMDQWSLVTTINNNTGDFSGQLDGIGYTFNFDWSWSYTPNDCCFRFVGDDYLTTELRSTFQNSTDIYAINRSYEVLKFNRDDGTFSVVSNYPGNRLEAPEVNDDIVSLVQGNKAYIGMSLYWDTQETINFLDLYELDLETLEWREIAPFPFPINTQREIGQVNGEVYSYIVFNEGVSAKGHIWKFNPEKVIYLDN